jgi:hypothetical protein
MLWYKKFPRKLKFSLLRVSDLLGSRAGNFRRAAQMGTGYGPL